MEMVAPADLEELADLEGGEAKEAHLGYSADLTIPCREMVEHRVMQGN